jgi:hypothetical protein
LTFAPSNQEWDGKFREIKIKVNRAGVEARYRQGYRATPEFGDNIAVRKGSLEEAVASPLLFTGLGMVAKVVQAPTTPTAEVPHARFRIVMDTGDIRFSQDARGLWIANLDIATVVHDAQGQTLQQLVRTMRVSLKQDRYEEFRKAGMGMNGDIDAPLGAVGARVVVRDLSSGAMGSVDLPFAPMEKMEKEEKQ